MSTTRSNYRLYFYHYKSKTNSRGDHPLYCRICISNTQTQFSTGVFIKPEQWCGQTKKCIGNDAEMLNLRLSEIKNQIDLLYLDLRVKKKTITAERLREMYANPKEVHTILSCYKAMLEQQQRLVDKTITASTFATFKVYAHACERFIKVYYHKKDLYLDQVKSSTLKDFEMHLKIEGQKPAYIHKVLVFFKRVIIFAHENEWIEKNPLQYVKVKSGPKKEITYLTEEELERLRLLQLPEELEAIRDSFVFSCETGLAYSDVMSITRESITDFKGRLWLFGNRQKSGTPYAIPLTGAALTILERYHYKIPQISNQQANKYLRLFAQAAAINKHLHFHMGRKTKASLMLNSGVPEVTICRVLGLKKSDILRDIYAKLELHKVASDMAAYEDQQTVHTIPMEFATTIKPAVELPIPKPRNKIKTRPAKRAHLAKAY